MRIYLIIFLNCLFLLILQSCSYSSGKQKKDVAEKAKSSSQIYLSSASIGSFKKAGIDVTRSSKKKLACCKAPSRISSLSSISTNQ